MRIQHTRRRGRVIMLVALLAMAASLSAQELYDRQVLTRLGLSPEEAGAVERTVRETAAQTARLNAELNVKKAELARLLLAEDPNERQIERNLRESAETEVRMRMLEIQRELAIREIVGTDRWTAILREVRSRVRQDASAPLQQFMERFQELHREFRQRQMDLIERLGAGERAEAASALAAQLRAIESEYRELVELLRQR